MCNSLAPYLFFKLSGITPSLFGLLQFNLIIHYIGAILLAFLTWTCLKPLISSATRLSVATLIGTSIYIFNLESLYSHGVIYWHHSPWMIVWIGQLYCFSQIFGDIDHNHNSSASWLTRTVYLILAFISPLLEWAGFVGNLTLAILPFLIPFGVRKSKKITLSLLIVGMTCSSALVLVCHYLLVLDKQLFFDALRSRFLVRSIESYYADGVPRPDLRTLFFHYWESLTGFLLFAFILSIIFLFGKWHLQSSDKQSWLKFKLVLFASMTILIENFLLLEHASSYNFSRLKLIIPVSLSIAAVVGLAPLIWSNIMIALVAFSLVLNIQSFMLSSRGEEIAYIFQSNARIMRTLEQVVQPCSVWFTNGVVRGWINLYLQRGIYEGYLLEDFTKVTDQHFKAGHACQGVFLKSVYSQSGIHDFRAAYVYDPVGIKLYQVQVSGSKTDISYTLNP